MRHYMKLNPAPFDMIKSGRKTIELRLNDEKRQNVSLGDEIEFANTENSEQKILVKVIDIHRLPTFEELYQSLPLLKCGYTEEDISTAKASDMELYYSKEQQLQYGVLGIEISVIQ